MILSCQNICKAFGEKVILNDASFHIEDREKAALIGCNGAGKTTLLRIIMQEISADSGTVVLARDKNIGYLAQYQDIHGHHTIYEELLTTKQHIIDMERRIRNMEQEMNTVKGDDLNRLMETYTRLTHQFELENGYAYKSELTGVLKGLGFTEEDYDKQIEKLRQEREQLLIEQARLEASGNIKDLRGRLQDGHPCPVCGSTHHPFANQVPVAPVSALTLQLQDLSNKKETYVAHTRHLTRLQQQLLQLHKELADSEAACKEMAGKQQLAASRQEREEAIVKEQSTLLTQSLSAADLLFGNSEWQKAWLQNPEVFRKTLTDFARQWHENTEKLHQLERQESAQKAECESLASFLPSLEKQAEEAGQLHEKNRATFSSLQAERKKLLNGRSADSVEQEYIRRMEELKERLKKLSATQTEQSGIADQTRGIADQIAKDLTEASADLLRRKAALDKWTADYLDSSGGEPLEVILSRFTQEKTELAFRLRTQTENKAKVSGLQEELNVRRSESERWAKLNELAGSADGAKFRRIAQGYTLDILLNYANVQLRELTRRYRLERVPETLALQVIDRDMCDEVRTVHSLSGGESFLVSLALALGLSSLSSNRMRVESLFIDEGFGSLDAETLRVAMDALESLRTQGRKIGVISHVQEMTERIPVRICVNRAGNGRSFLEVL